MTMIWDLGGVFCFFLFAVSGAVRRIGYLNRSHAAKVYGVNRSYVVTTKRIPTGDSNGQSGREITWIVGSPLN